ncbi:MAG: NADPH-dependent glutamate synthase [Treponema sp.]|jgi:glutamate synthase (NADPH/NADH) small chain|nr:NADPH-dependent glutamate synthase [Treponema sp.]
MNRILSKRQLSEEVFEITVTAPLVARARKAGQFFIVQIDTDWGERIPLTIADADEKQGTITMVFQSIGATTRKLARLEPGDYVENILGPLGNPTHIEKFGSVVCVGGGIGAAPLYPIVQALKNAGNKVTVITGARTKDLVIFEDRMRRYADELIIVTDDGSYGQKALVTEPLKKICAGLSKPDMAVAIGPPIMMKFCVAAVKEFNIPIMVSLNTIMIDGTGMCGGCRVTVGGETKFVCVDGPEFDGYKVDFENMMSRLKAYKDREDKDSHKCRINPEPLSVKERMAIPPQEMPVQEPQIRRNNMNEVALGYREDQARLEAERCLGCRNEPCVKGCPVQVPIPRFIAEIQKGNFKAAAGIIKETNLLPAVCGRVCPQEKQCQEHCTLGKSLKDVDKAVAIGRLERFAADWERAQGKGETPAIKPKTGKRAAVIGSGPAGLTAAADLAREGHEVTIFEAFHKPGGVMVYGIPEFRLPKSIVKEEVENLQKMGVKIELNFLAGRTRTIEELLGEDGFEALFIGVGAGLPKFLGCPGENLVGVFSANEYLTRTNLMKAYDADKAATPVFTPKIAAVIGGGNVAMDAARMALRLGAGEVHVIYRRTREEMPARAEEVTHAVEEGVIFDFLRNPSRILGDEKNRVTGMELQQFKLGDPDASGRRSPVPIEGSEYVFPCDTVIVALGNESNPLIVKTTAGLASDKRGRIVVDENQKTSLDKVYAGGDIVLGAATVILAMGEGRRAAAAINALLSTPK